METTTNLSISRPLVPKLGFELLLLLLLLAVVVTAVAVVVIAVVIGYPFQWPSAS
jgi:hypothetical protein